MGIVGAMYSGISGLNSNSTMMEIIGNNLANINTPAFKHARADFSDILSATSGGQTIGRGARVGSTRMVLTQGGFQATENVTDIALAGPGFFMVNDQASHTLFYTRSGNFRVDKSGYMTSPAGHRLQGYEISSDGRPVGTPRDIRVPQTPLQPKITDNVSLYANLDSQSEVVGPFDVTDPVNTSNFTASITVYDSLGNAHQLTVYFDRDPVPGAGGGNVWNYHVVVDAEDAAGGVDFIAADGELEFTAAGSLLELRAGALNDFDFSGNPEQNQIISFDFGTSVAVGGTGVDGTTQFGEGSALVFASQDGYSTSYIDSINIDEDGKVIALYANGEAEEIAQVAVVNFTNPLALDHRGDNMFGSTTESGEPVASVANVSGNGAIFSKTLELSNVDIAAQFGLMITTQRGFQANSRSIRTADELISELINLIR
ncbi:MAG: flagellar hook protein FlgE [Candidatus Lernaella stagnicola]|nr:flagellar hook protein FlgE [Candidatus Lernaella stagnicola]